MLKDGKDKRARESSGVQSRERTSVSEGLRASATGFARRFLLRRGDGRRAHDDAAAAAGGAGAAAVGTEGRPHPRPFRVGKLYPVIPRKLAFAVFNSDEMVRREIQRRPDVFFCSSDFHEQYEAFCADFGPIKLSGLHHFIYFLKAYMEHPQLENRPVVYYTEETPALRTNGAYLLCAYLVVELGYTPEEAWENFTVITGNPFLAYRDATYCRQDYFLGILACCQGIKKAVSLGWYDPEKFDVEEYEWLDNPANADLHRVCPKFVAFKGPSEVTRQVMDGVYTFPPHHYCEIFSKLGVGAVVRLNEPSTYDSRGFTENGVRHYELEFDDCTVPSRSLVQRFLEICEGEQGSVGVHCKAGLGRTGTLIAVYWMKHFGMTASECIGWLRVARPGSVIGPQQQWLHWAEGVYKDGGDGGGGEEEGPNRLTAEESAALGLAVAEAQNQRARQMVAGREGGGGGAKQG